MSISMCMQNFKSLSQYSTQFKRQGHFHFFRIWSSAKARPMKNVISQSLGLDRVNINVYAKVYQNIPLSSRNRAIFTFSELEPRQRLGQSQMTFDNPLGYILSISMHMQNFIKYSKRFKSYRHFSRTGRGQNLHKQSKDKIFTNCPVTKSNV